MPNKRHYRNYTEEDFINAVKNSTSIAQVLKTLNLNPTGGNYKSANDKIKHLSLDISHFNQQGWAKGKTFPPRRNIEEYLNNICSIGSHHLKTRLIKENLKELQCEKCSITTWNNEPISFDLHHIDGNPSNNNLSNLQILCPNCHSQTPNHRGKNIKFQKTIEEKRELRKQKQFKETGHYPNPNWRTEPKVNQRKVERPSKEELAELIKNNSWSALGRQFNVSDNAVRKWAKYYQLI